MITFDRQAEPFQNFGRSRVMVIGRSVSFSDPPPPILLFCCVLGPHENLFADIWSYHPIQGSSIWWLDVFHCIIRYSPPGMPYGFVRIFILFFIVFILLPPRFPDDNFWPPRRTVPEFWPVTGHGHRKKCIVFRPRTTPGWGRGAPQTPPKSPSKICLASPPIFFQLINCVVTYGTVRCGAVRCGAVRCGAARCGAVRCGAVRYGIKLLNITVNISIYSVLGRSGSASVLAGEYERVYNHIHIESTDISHVSIIIMLWLHLNADNNSGYFPSYIMNIIPVLCKCGHAVTLKQGCIMLYFYIPGKSFLWVNCSILWEFNYDDDGDEYGDASDVDDDNDDEDHHNNINNSIREAA